MTLMVYFKRAEFWHRTPSGQTIVKPTALGPVANTDTKLLIYGLFQKGRVLAQDGVVSKNTNDSGLLVTLDPTSDGDDQPCPGLALPPHDRGF